MEVDDFILDKYFVNNIHEVLTKNFNTEFPLDDVLFLLFNVPNYAVVGINQLRSIIFERTNSTWSFGRGVFFMNIKDILLCLMGNADALASLLARSLLSRQPGIGSFLWAPWRV